MSAGKRPRRHFARPPEVADRLSASESDGEGPQVSRESDGDELDVAGSAGPGHEPNRQGFSRIDGRPRDTTAKKPRTHHPRTDRPSPRTAGSIDGRRGRDESDANEETHEGSGTNRGTNSGTDSGTDSESDSKSDNESDNESDSESDSDSDEYQTVLRRPTFVPKSRRAVKTEPQVVETKAATLEMIERAVNLERRPVIDGVDDTDGLDPVGEYAAWKARERARLQREHERLAEIERQYEERQELREKNDAAGAFAF